MITRSRLRFLASSIKTCYLCTLLLLRLHEELAVNFLKNRVVLTVFLGIAEVCL